ncbi:hypothetical protein [Fictibacillus terranigra]|uniref:DUF3955 domain-containing protein n=1 Tax=Fictibacillus terranigra TaxID=3058424 RepID=A0ABT8EAS4_9BACL|nr:hypothetical protein [Fictibacillus sp. CENA-BCM004]MDN4075018.1 hypothetical protein [Fictibacillus sp. CENA-BCM004]
MARKLVYFGVFSFILFIVLFKILLRGKPAEENWLVYLTPMGLILLALFLMICVILGFILWKKSKD